ncbi:MAG: hypothetical protein R3E10_08670 [Gemmatimonadota bacterium]
MKSSRGPRRSLALVAGVLLLGGCQTLREIAALERVDFSLDRAEHVRLAGLELDRVRSIADVSGFDIARVGASIAAGSLPLELDLVVGALNPEENPTQARLVRMEWTLLLEDRETVSGVFDQATVLPPGVRTAVPIHVGLDLVDFFEGSARDLVELALSLSGQGGAPKNVKLRALPIIDTALGPIRYPTPITILSENVGG